MKHVFISRLVFDIISTEIILLFLHVILFPIRFEVMYGNPIF